MLQHLFSYQNETEKLLADSPAKTSWDKELSHFNTAFTHLQVERLIHLIVTMTVGIATLVSCVATFVVPAPALLVVDVVLIVLFLAYILHYRKLENTAQSWYVLLRALQKKTK